MPHWPLGVPTGALIGSLRETPDRNVGSFKPDVGPALEGRRSSVPSTTINYDNKHMTNAQYEELLDWYEADLENGTLWFTMTHPRTQLTVDAICTDTFKLARTEGLFLVISVSIRITPPAAQPPISA